MATADLEGKTAIVTGGSSGIGLHTVMGLASRGARVVSTCRDVERGERIAAAARARAGGMHVTSMPLDLESWADVRRFASSVGAAAPVDVLVHNAGAVYPTQRTTVDGVDAQLAVIHLGPLLLTHLLAGSLSPHARIVHVVSDLHKQARVEPPARWGMISSYAHAELRKVMCAWELQRRMPDRIVSCVHPGGVRTRLFRSVGGPFGALLWLSDLLKMPPSLGARGSLHAATAKERTAYWTNSWLGVRRGRPSRISEDEAACARIYDEDCARAGLPP